MMLRPLLRVSAFFVVGIVIGIGIRLGLPAASSIGPMGVAFIGWMLTLGGWFLGARLSERSQKRLFLHKVLDDARHKVVTAIRREQDWAREVNGLGWQFDGQRQMRAALREIDARRAAADAAGNPQVARLLGESAATLDRGFWLQQNEKGRRALYANPGSADLVLVLEEHELLFPETRHVRSQLGFFSSERIISLYSTLLSDLMSDDRRDAAIDAMMARGNRNADYQALLEDLRIHVQNKALAEITEHRVAQRQPRDPNVPIMATRTDGLLDIREHGQSWPVPTWPEEPLPDWWL